MAISVCNSKDFCQTFAKNGYKIDFGFNNKWTQFGEEVINLVIDDNFWTISNDFNDKRLEFKSNDSQTNSVFGKHYSMAFYTHYGRIGLIRVLLNLLLFLNVFL